MWWLVPDLQKPSSAGIMGLDAFLHEGREILIVHPKFGSPYAPCILPLLLGVLSKELWEWGPHWRSGCCDMSESIFDVRWWCGVVKDRIDRKETEANMLIADSFRNFQKLVIWLIYINLSINNHQKPRGLFAVLFCRALVGRALQVTDPVPGIFQEIWANCKYFSILPGT